MNAASIEQIFAHGLKDASPVTQELAQAHRGLIVMAAREATAQCHRHGIQGLLLMFGVRGFVQAVARYDARPGTSFSTFAWYRVRGAIQDGARLAGYARRGRHGGASLVPLSAPGLTEVTANGPESFDDEADLIAVESTQEAMVEQAWRAVRVREAVAALPEPARTLVRRCDLGSEPLGAVAQDLGISTGWACRQRRRAYATLRLALRDLSPDAGASQVCCAA